MAKLTVVGGAADLFSYAALSREDEAEVRQVAERIKLRLRRTAEDIIEIGRDLTAMKEKLGHGQFLPWIEAEFGFSETTARRWMNVAKAYGDKYATVADFAPKVLYELIDPSTPPRRERRPRRPMFTPMGKSLCFAGRLPLLSPLTKADPSRTPTRR